MQGQTPSWNSLNEESAIWLQKRIRLPYIDLHRARSPRIWKQPQTVMTDEQDNPAHAYRESEVPSLATQIEEKPKKRFEDLPPAAQRALKEAEARRREIDAKQNALPDEVNGRGGLEPTRYDDWEIKGLTVDF